MASVQVRVLDVSGSRICDVEAPDDVTVDRILVLMVEKMGLPLTNSITAEPARSSSTIKPC